VTVRLLRYAAIPWDHQRGAKVARTRLHTSGGRRSKSRVESRDLARPERFELPTTAFEAQYSIQLSYGRADKHSDRTSWSLPGHSASAAKIPILLNH
jgi:hypothetical protein